MHEHLKVRKCLPQNAHKRIANKIDIQIQKTIRLCLNQCKHKTSKTY